MTPADEEDKTKCVAVGIVNKINKCPQKNIYLDLDRHQSEKSDPDPHHPQLVGSLCEMSASRKNPNQTHPVINANVVENVGPDEVLIRLILDAVVQDRLELTQLDLSDCLDHFSARKNVRYVILCMNKQAAGI